MMRKRAIVKQGLHKLSPPIIPTMLSSREEQFPGPSPAWPCSRVVQKVRQEGAHILKWAGTKPARTDVLETDVLRQHVKHLVVIWFTMFLNQQLVIKVVSNGFACSVVPGEYNAIPFSSMYLNRAEDHKDKGKAKEVLPWMAILHSPLSIPAGHTEGWTGARPGHMSSLISPSGLLCTKPLPRNACCSFQYLCCGSYSTATTSLFSFYTVRQTIQQIQQVSI